MPSQLTFTFSTELLKTHLIMSGDAYSLLPTLQDQLCALNAKAKRWDVDYTHTRDDNHSLSNCHEIYRQIESAAAQFPGTHLEYSNVALASNSSGFAKKFSAEVGAVLGSANTHSMMTGALATHVLTFRLADTSDFQLLKKLTAAVAEAEALGQSLLNPYSARAGTPMLRSCENLLNKINSSASLRDLQNVLQGVSDGLGYCGIYWGQLSEQSFFEIRGRQGKLDPVSAEMWCRFWTGLVKGAMKGAKYKSVQAEEMDESKAIKEWARDKVLTSWYREQFDATPFRASGSDLSLAQVKVLGPSPSRVTVDSGYMSGSSLWSSSTESVYSSDYI